MTMDDQNNGPDGTSPPPPPETPPPAAPPPPPPAEPAPPAPASQPEGQKSDNWTLMIVLSYFGLLALIPLLVEKEDQEIQWHAKHGLVLTVAEFIALVVIQIVVFILGAISGGLGCIVGLIIPILVLAIIVVHIICIARGLKGERFMVPGVSEFTDRF